MTGPGMDLIADGLLIGAALTAAVYCHVLARKLRRLGDLDRGLGGAVAALSRQAEDLRKAMETARKAGGEQTRELARRTARAEAAAGRLEILIAALHDAESRLPKPLVRASAPRAEEADALDAGGPETDRPDAEEPGDDMPGAGAEPAEDAAHEPALAEAGPPEEEAPRGGLAAAIRALARGGAG